MFPTFHDLLTLQVQIGQAKTPCQETPETKDTVCDAN